MTGRRFTEAEVRKALEQSSSVTRAALLLGVSRKTVHEYIRLYAIAVQRVVQTT